MQRQAQKKTNTTKVVLAYIKPEDTRHWYRAFAHQGVHADLILRESEALMRLSQDPPDLLLLDSRPYHLKALAAVTAIAGEHQLRTTAVHVIVSRQAPAIYEQYWSAGAAACHDSEDDKSWSVRQMIGSVNFIKRLLQKTDHPAPVNAKDIILTNAARYLQENAFKLKDKTKLQTCLGVKAKELEALVKNTKGQTMRQWMAKEKMAYAAYLLDASSYTIADIADLLGYTTAGNFSTAFRLHHGQSPVSYRRTQVLNDQQNVRCR